MVTTPLSDFQFYNELGEKYPETMVVYASRAGKLRENYLARLLSEGRGKLLDVGCNDYLYEAYWHGEYVGVDIALIPLMYGNRNGVWCDAYSLPFRDRVFDFVLCVEVLEHLWYRVEAMREMLRVMKPSGELFLIVPLGDSPGNIVWMNELSRWDVTHYYYLHGELSLAYMRYLARSVPCNILEHKYLVSNQKHIYCRIGKCKKHG